MTPPITLGPLESTSPTAAAQMTICGLRAGLSSRKEADAWVLHDPRLWLGIALHSLLEKARNGVVGTDLGDAWQAEVRHFMEQAELHQFDRRFSNLVRWPNYYLMEERALSAAAELVAAANNAAGSARTQGQRLSHSGTERRLVARSGRLVGRPDRFDRNSITDYKSNLPDTSTALGVQFFRQDRRQIQIYAAIIAESFGFWPTTGIIAGASGETAEFPLAPAECDAEADAAVADLAAWNRALSSASRPSDIASPSESSCGRCPFQLVCPAFWTWLVRRSPNGTPSRAPVAAAGVLKSIQLGNDGDLQTISLDGVVSTQPGMIATSLVTRRSIHGPLLPSDIGSECRIVGAEMRHDGRLTADWRTVVVPADQIPRINLGPHAVSTSG
jgi:PD-(D/E)XK nuclease superfamily